MKKHIEKIKRQALQESQKAGLVILGAVGGLLAAKGLRKLTEDKPQFDAIAQYSIPVLMAGGGFLLTTVTDEKSKLKYLGYGLEVAGTIEGVKLIPVAKEYLSGFLGETDIPAASAFYTESEERQKLINGFGLSSLPIGNASMQEMSGNDVRLPDLDGLGYNADQVEGLGYNESQVEGLGYNASQTGDDLSGII